MIMKDKLGDEIKRFEIYKNYKIKPNVYFAIRIDGRNFSNFAKKMKYRQPYDDKFKQIIVKVAKGLMEEFNARLAYTQSDEISLIFDKNLNLFDRRIEKLISITASYASCKFSQEVQLKDRIVMFDSRIIIFSTKEKVLDYFQWRQIDAMRNVLNSWCYWTLRKKGKSKKQAESELKGKGKEYKDKLLLNYRIDFNDIPLWQIRGILFKWEKYHKQGFNPIENKKEIGLRRKIKINEELPIGHEFRTYINDLLGKK